MKKKSKQEKLKVDVDFECPFCGKEAFVNMSLGAVIHSLPVCRIYDQLSALDYIEAVNDKSYAEVGRIHELQIKRKRFDEQN